MTLACRWHASLAPCLGTSLANFSGRLFTLTGSKRPEKPRLLRAHLRANGLPGPGGCQARSSLVSRRNAFRCRCWVAASHSLFPYPVWGRPCPGRGCLPHRGQGRRLPNRRPNPHSRRRAHPGVGTEAMGRAKEPDLVAEPAMGTVAQPAGTVAQPAGTAACPDRDCFLAVEAGRRIRGRPGRAATNPPRHSRRRKLACRQRPASARPSSQLAPGDLRGRAHWDLRQRRLFRAFLLRHRLQEEAPAPKIVEEGTACRHPRLPQRPFLQQPAPSTTTQLAVPRTPPREAPGRSRGSGLRPRHASGGS
jgi:hypothetical protein